MGRELGLQHRNVNSGKADGAKRRWAPSRSPLAHCPPGWMSRGRHGGHLLPVDIHRSSRDALAFSSAAAPPCSAPELGRGNGHEHEEVHGAAVLFCVSPQEVSVEELKPK